MLTFPPQSPKNEKETKGNEKDMKRTWKEMTANEKEMKGNEKETKRKCRVNVRTSIETGPFRPQPQRPRVGPAPPPEAIPDHTIWGWRSCNLQPGIIYGSQGSLCPYARTRHGLEPEVAVDLLNRWVLWGGCRRAQATSAIVTSHSADRRR